MYFVIKMEKWTNTQYKTLTNTVRILRMDASGIEIGDTRINDRPEASPPTQTLTTDISSGWSSKICTISVTIWHGSKSIQSFKVNTSHFIF